MKKIVNITGRPRLDDMQVACNITKNAREYARNLIQKKISIPLKIDDINLKCATFITYNKSTGKYSIAGHGIRHNKGCIHPTTHQKSEQHILDILKQHREASRKCNTNNLKKE